MRRRCIQSVSMVRHQCSYIDRVCRRLTCPPTFVIARTTAFFSLVWLSVDDAQPMITELTEYAPIGNMKHAMYRPAVLSVLAAMTNPTMATRSPIVMCHVRSCMRPELQPVMIPATPASRKGGHVRTRVIVRLKPRVLTTLEFHVSIPYISSHPVSIFEGRGNTYVGKNELNEHALKWKFCIKQNNHVLGSLHA
jgi:hypothetical protein